VRSHARGERVHQAMLARGWRGSMPRLVPLHFAGSDAAFVALVILPLITLRLGLGIFA
jgi:energy-coupling factor transporter transmembrane protein EcfT